MYIPQAIIDGDYRYSLSRQWDQTLPRVLFIMLNPSTYGLGRKDPEAQCNVIPGSVIRRRPDGSNY